MTLLPPLQVAIIQTSLAWENPSANRIQLKKKIEAITAPYQLIVLPEMFTTGFTMNVEAVAERMNGETISWMKDIAVNTNAAIMGSLIIKEDSNYYNRLVFITAEGAVQHYDKRHLFTLAGEEKVFTAGNDKLIIEYNGWRICPLICYDLRFPVWARNTEDYDVLIYVANWPQPRIKAWDALLQARAIENITYCIGVNRVGLDGNNHNYSGHSAVFNELGDRLDNFIAETEASQVISLSKERLLKTRQKLNFLNDKDQFTLK
ncbi:MAG: nitrilase family protein [Bacteroidetes bacterium MedPE-SWsnd-G2]|nr:MAG: nitrilase family protein [Bacteroidetes bacterium MedPE-SWsnd-G2]